MSSGNGTVDGEGTVHGTGAGGGAPELPPATAVEAEASVLGAILLREGLLDQVAVDEQLLPDDFWLEANAVIYAAMLEMREEDVAIDDLTLVAHLKRTGRLDAIGGAAAVDVLTAAVPNVGNWREYAREVRDAALRRRLRQLGHSLIEHANRPNVAELLARTEHDLAELSGPTSRRRVMTIEAFLALPREPLEPYITAMEGRTVLLARGTGKIIGGPSGVGKSLAAIDLAGLLASDDGGSWLGTMVHGGRRVLLISLEGSFETTQDRLDQLVSDPARRRLVIDDHWHVHRSIPTHREIAAMVRQHQIDVVVFDTLAAWLQGRPGIDISKGIPEEAHADIEAIRRASRRPIAWIGVAHTRKMDRSANSITDELEELAGTIHKKADAAVIIRRDGAEGPRRKVRFAKVRTGPEPPQKIATLPEPDSQAPPRMIVVAEARSQVREGTESERIAEWIAAQDGPQTVSVITAAVSISDDALRRRRKSGELEALGIRYDHVPGTSSTHAYGTEDQWRQAYGLIPEIGAKR